MGIALAFNQMGRQLHHEAINRKTIIQYLTLMTDAVITFNQINNISKHPPKEILLQKWFVAKGLTVETDSKSYTKC